MEIKIEDKVFLADTVPDKDGNQQTVEMKLNEISTPFGNDEFIWNSGSSAFRVCVYSSIRLQVSKPKGSSADQLRRIAEAVEDAGKPSMVITYWPGEGSETAEETVEYKEADTLETLVSEFRNSHPGSNILSFTGFPGPADIGEDIDKEVWFKKKVKEFADRHFADFFQSYEIAWELEDLQCCIKPVEHGGRSGHQIFCAVDEYGNGDIRVCVDDSTYFPLDGSGFYAALWWHLLINR